MKRRLVLISVGLLFLVAVPFAIQQRGELKKNAEVFEGKVKLLIARAAGEPIITTWTPVTCRTATIQYRGNTSFGETRTQSLTVAMGPASWQVVYKQNNIPIYLETWLAGDGSGGAVDFDDTVGQSPRGEGSIDPPATVTFGTGTDCSGRRQQSNPSCGVRQGFPVNCSFPKLTLTTTGDYGALLEEYKELARDLTGNISYTTNSYAISSIPRGWTVNGGTP